MQIIINNNNNNKSFCIRHYYSLIYQEVVNTPADKLQFQQNIDCLLKWADDSLVGFNTLKCFVMAFNEEESKNSPTAEYTLGQSARLPRIFIQQQRIIVIIIYY